MRRISLSYKSIWIAITIVISVIAIISLWHLKRTYDVQQEYHKALSQPREFPDWLVATGPVPGQTLSVKDANFGEASSDDPFWPGYGVICIQIHNPEMATESDIQSRTTLLLNGYPVRELRFGTLMWKGSIFDGFVFASQGSDNPEVVNLCWRMILMPGEYLASIEFQSTTSQVFEYSWGFHLTE